jgi:hypothetical protein
MQQLIYMSAATHLLTDDELQQLLEQARRNNTQAAITGLLLYHEGRFMQLIEGPAPTVAALYERIEQDPRHTDTAKLADKEVDGRSFPEWAMAGSGAGLSFSAWVCAARAYSPAGARPKWRRFAPAQNYAGAYAAWGGLDQSAALDASATGCVVPGV